MVLGPNGEASEGKKWQRSLAELYCPPFADKWRQVGPKHPAWPQRVKLEVLLLGKYVEFLRSENAKPWFVIKPDPNPQYKGMIWRGEYMIPDRPHLRFDIVIVLNGDYPKVTPRAFMEESIVPLAGSKIYLENRFPPQRDREGNWMRDPATGKSFVMICHDHMSEVEDAWTDNLGIVHFFIREFWMWQAVMQRYIIEADNNHRLG